MGKVKYLFVISLLFMQVAKFYGGNVVNINGVNYALDLDGNFTARVISSQYASGDITILSEINITNDSDVSVENGIYRVVSIDELAFHNSDITSLYVPNSVNSIKWASFENCTSLNSIRGCDGIRYIGEEAFKNCYNLTSICFGQALEEIGKNAFNGCSSLKKVIVKDLSAWCKTKFNNNSNPISLGGHIYSDENTEIVNMVLPQDIMYIADYAFEGCHGLQSLIIPSNCQEIGKCSFANCSNLSSVNVEAGRIGIQAFQHCDKLKTVYIGDAVTYIGSWAFGSNSIEIESLTFGSCILTIDMDAFSNVKKVIVKDIKSWCSSTFESNPIMLSKNTFSDENTEIENLIIPEGVTTVPRRAFSGSLSLKSVSFPNSLSCIEGASFYNCSYLENVIFPNQLNDIEGYAFCNTGLKTIKITSVNAIENAAFSNCASLLAVEVSNYISSLGEVYGDDWDGVFVEDGVFESCKNLKSVSLPKGLNVIGASTFYNCVFRDL